MDFIKYIRSSIRYYRTQHLLILLGALLTTTVITGSLITGDSVRKSMRSIVEKRLGSIEFVVQCNERLFRQELSSEMSFGNYYSASSVFMLNGMASNPEQSASIGSVQIVGIDSIFPLMAEIGSTAPGIDEIWLSERTSQQLMASEGDEIILKSEKFSSEPNGVPFAGSKEPYVSSRLKVTRILSSDQLGNFSLDNNQRLPFNVFVSIGVVNLMQGTSGKANRILISDSNGDYDANFYSRRLDSVWSLEDAGLHILPYDSFSCKAESDNLFIRDEIVRFFSDNFSGKGSVLTYLVNSIEHNNSIAPYSFISAVPDQFFKEKLRQNEIIVNQYLADDLTLSPGDSIELKYYIFISSDSFIVDNSSFVIKEIIPIESEGISPGLMPDFTGISGKDNCRDWSSDIPIDLSKVRDTDEQYWKKYQGTPKAYIAMESGIKIWGTQYGNANLILLNNQEHLKEKVVSEFRNYFDPEDFNIVLENVREEGEQSSVGSVDFGSLFLSLGFFVILSGLLLTILLHYLNLRFRFQEQGILSALGFSRSAILRLKILENLPSVILGAALGTLAGAGYSLIIVKAINSIWNDIVRTEILEVSLLPATICIGFIAGFIVTIIVIIISTVRFFRKRSGHFPENKLKKTKNKKSDKIVLPYLTVAMFVFPVILLILDSKSGHLNPVYWLLAGGLFLVGLNLLSAWYIKGRDIIILNGIVHLALKNLRAAKMASIAIVSLISAGTFVVIITGSNKETFFGTEFNNSSGTGGYKLYSEFGIPLQFSLQTSRGQEKYGIQDADSLSSTEFLEIRGVNGDDASCLNLNKVVNPQIVGVSTSVLNERGSFTFAELLFDEYRENPWLILEKELDKNVLPAIADISVITWGLKKKLGDTLQYRNEKGEVIFLVLVGALSNSIFQGKVIISDMMLQKQFPSSKTGILLTDCKSENIGSVISELNDLFKDYGIESSRTSDRLAVFYSVTNTYLAVFMLLGAIGILIATIGIGIMIYRNLLDRRPEFAIMAAIGFSMSKVQKIVFVEYLMLIIYGIFSGFIASIIGILPSVISPAYKFPGMFVFVLITAIFVNALIWAYFPVSKIVKQKEKQILRNE